MADRGGWSSVSSYDAGDAAFYNGMYWIAKNHVGYGLIYPFNTPPDRSGDWYPNVPVTHVTPVEILGAEDGLSFKQVVINLLAIVGGTTLGWYLRGKSKRK